MSGEGERSQSTGVPLNSNPAPPPPTSANKHGTCCIIANDFFDDRIRNFRVLSSMTLTNWTSNCSNTASNANWKNRRLKKPNNFWSPIGSAAVKLNWRIIPKAELAMMKKMKMIKTMRRIRGVDGQRRISFTLIRKMICRRQKGAVGAVGAAEEEDEAPGVEKVWYNSDTHTRSEWLAEVLVMHRT